MAAEQWQDPHTPSALHAAGRPLAGLPGFRRRALIATFAVILMPTIDVGEFHLPEVYSGVHWRCCAIPIDQLREGEELTWGGEFPGHPIAQCWCLNCTRKTPNYQGLLFLKLQRLTVSGLKFEFNARRRFGTVVRFTMSNIPYRYSVALYALAERTSIPRV